MVNSTLGPVPFELIVARLQLGSVDRGRIDQRHVRLGSGEGARGQQEGKTGHKKFRDCRELHSCSFFDPEVTSGSGWGGPVRDQREILVFPHESHTMLPLGLSVRLTSLCFRYGGSVTWAAKTECERIPKPRKKFRQSSASPLRRLFAIYIVRLRTPHRRSSRRFFGAH
jgi:hypothetical protein